MGLFNDGHGPSAVSLHGLDTLNVVLITFVKSPLVENWKVDNVLGYVCVVTWSKGGVGASGLRGLSRQSSRDVYCYSLGCWLLVAQNTSPVLLSEDILGNRQPLRHLLRYPEKNFYATC